MRVLLPIIFLLLSISIISGQNQQACICDESRDINIPIEESGILFLSIELRAADHHLSGCSCPAPLPSDYQGISVEYSVGSNSGSKHAGRNKISGAGSGSEFCVKQGDVISFHIEGSGYYNIIIGFEDQYNDYNEPNDTEGQAALLPQCTEISAVINYGETNATRDVKDYYRFAINGDATYTLDFLKSRSCLDIEWIRGVNSNRTSRNQEFDGLREIYSIVPESDAQEIVFYVNSSCGQCANGYKLFLTENPPDMGPLAYSNIVEWDPGFNSNSCLEYQNSNTTLIHNCTGTVFKPGGCSSDFLPRLTSGYLEYTIDKTDQHIFFGLTTECIIDDTPIENIEYGMSIQEGKNKMQLNIFESGQDQYNRNVYFGDKLRIYREVGVTEDNQLTTGTVSYSLIRNGIEIIFYQNTMASTEDLFVASPVKSLSRLSRLVLNGQWVKRDKYDCFELIR